MAKSSKVKVKISGSVVEFWKFENPIFLEGNSSGGRRKASEAPSEKSDEYRKQNSRRSKADFRSLVSANFRDGDKFLTLTFRDTSEFDIRNVADTNKQFKKFIQRLRYHMKKIGKDPDFRYLAVIEFQDENKRGAVHYHLLADLPFIPFEDLAAIWGLGFIGINRVEGVDNLGAYISKYMSKDAGDPRLKGKKNYLPSKGLDKPITLYGSDAAKLLAEYEKGQKKEVFQDAYDSDHFGTITYKEYNLKREVKQTKIGKGMQEKLAAAEQIQGFINHKSEKTLTEKIETFQEEKDNGTITINSRVLEDVQRRASKPVFKEWDRKYISGSLLGGDREPDRPTTSDPDHIVYEAAKLSFQIFVEQILGRSDY